MTVICVSSLHETEKYMLRFFYAFGRHFNTVHYNARHVHYIIQVCCSMGFKSNILELLAKTINTETGYNSHIRSREKLEKSSKTHFMFAL